MSKVIQGFFTPMARAINEAARDNAPGTVPGYGLNNIPVPDEYTKNLALGIDFGTPGVTSFDVALGSAHDKLAALAQVERDTGADTVH